ncbi:uncharacterized [Tachysurus ichikawai]
MAVRFEEKESVLAVTFMLIEASRNIKRRGGEKKSAGSENAPVLCLSSVTKLDHSWRGRGRDEEGGRKGGVKGWRAVEGQRGDAAVHLAPFSCPQEGV